MTEKTVADIASVSDAFSFAAVGIGIDFLVLLIVFLSVLLIAKLEHFILKYRIPLPTETPIVSVDKIDPMIVAAITAAVYEYNHSLQVKSVYMIGHDARHPEGWGTRGTSKSRYR
ncbi:MAG: OadG family protein [Deferribacteraceae bacterium]|jgi:Na+-transporting methylmalonyl-CoA/oxaloacetate decarboxylase gamma subunit|nr:OadG family protein [Deferribacteraceae bacterium]